MNSPSVLEPYSTTLFVGSTLSSATSSLPVSLLKVVVYFTDPLEPSSITFVSPSLSSGLCLYSVSWPSSTIFSTGLTPILTILSSFSVIVFVVSVGSPTGLESLTFWVIVTSSLPAFPSFSIFWVPDSKVSS